MYYQYYLEEGLERTAKKTSLDEQMIIEKMKETIPEIEEVIDYLECWDVNPTKENIKRVLNQWIENLYSHIGNEAHKHSLECGVVDETGMTWEEQDRYMLQQIDRYKRCLAGIEISEGLNENEFLLVRELKTELEKQMETERDGWERPIGYVSFGEETIEMVFDAEIGGYSATMHDKDGNPRLPYINGESIEEILKEIIVSGREKQEGKKPKIDMLIHDAKDKSFKGVKEDEGRNTELSGNLLKFR